MYILRNIIYDSKILLLVDVNISYHEHEQYSFSQHIYLFLIIDYILHYYLIICFSVDPVETEKRIDCSCSLLMSGLFMSLFD